MAVRTHGPSGTASSGSQPSSSPLRQFRHFRSPSKAPIFTKALNRRFPSCHLDNPRRVSPERRRFRAGLARAAAEQQADLGLGPRRDRHGSSSRRRSASHHGSGARTPYSFAASIWFNPASGGVAVGFHLPPASPRRHLQISSFLEGIQRQRRPHTGVLAEPGPASQRPPLHRISNHSVSRPSAGGRPGPGTRRRVSQVLGRWSRSTRKRSAQGGQRSANFNSIQPGIVHIRGPGRERGSPRAPGPATG